MYYLFRLIYFLANKKLLKKSWWLFYYFDFFRKKIVFKNLDIAFSNLDKKEKIKIAKDTYKNFLSFFEDIVEFDKNGFEIEIINEEFLLNAIKSNRPLILMTAHFGNWEIAPRYISKKYNLKLAIVQREIENKKIKEFFEKIRKNENIKLINKKRASKEIVKALIKEKRALGILIDQNTNSKHALKVKFFIPNTPFNPAISKLSKSLNAIVLPIFCYKDNGYKIEFKAPKTFSGSIEEFTQWQAEIIEEMIKKYPSQYYWFHNRFKRVK